MQGRIHFFHDLNKYPMSNRILNLFGPPFLKFIKINYPNPSQPDSIQVNQQNFT